MEEPRLPGLRGLYANPRVLECAGRPRGDWASSTSGHHVRRSGALALPSIANCGCGGHSWMDGAAHPSSRQAPPRLTFSHLSPSLTQVASPIQPQAPRIPPSLFSDQRLIMRVWILRSSLEMFVRDRVVLPWWRSANRKVGGFQKNRPGYASLACI